MKLIQVTLVLILTTAIGMPAHANSAKTGIRATQLNYLSQSRDPLDEVMEQSVKLKKTLDSIRNDPQTTTMKKRELLTNFYPQWQANTVNFINVMKRKNASREELASTQLQLNKYIGVAFVCEDSGTAMCAE